MKKIKIAEYVVSRSYIDTTGISYSFICDMRYKRYYILKGTVSLLWEKILLTSSYDKVLSFAVEHNSRVELNELLSELKERQIIFINKNFEFLGYKYLSKHVDEKNEDSFLALYAGISKIIKNNYLINSVMLSLGYKCNLLCKHCFNPKNKNTEEISFENVKKFIDQAYDIGVSYVTITGGECTYHKDFIDIIKYIRSKHLFLSFFTNAQILADDDYFDEVMRLYPYQLRISLYSMNPDVHDNITNVKGSHQKTLKVIKKLRERDINLVINCPVFNINLNDYLQVDAFAKEIGATSLYSPYFINNPDNNNSYLKLSEETLENFYFEEIKNNRSDKELFIKNSKCLCDERMNYICLSSNLNYTLCNDFNYPIGNLNTTPLKVVWEEVVPQLYKKITRENLKDCFKEDYCKYCIYCPKFAMFDSEFMKRSNALCEHARAYYNAMNRYNAIKKYENLKKG